jgi:hypothetical protein
MADATSNRPRLAVLAVVAWLVILGIGLVLSGAARGHWWVPVLLSLGAAALAAASPVRTGEANAATQASLPIVNDGSPAASPSVALRVDGISLPKLGNSDEENEDAFAVEVAEGYVAVADGASSSYRAREWAQLLSSDFVSNRPLRTRSATREWLATVGQRFGPAVGQDTEFWAQDAAQRGSHASFLGVSVFEHGEGYGLRAVAVGDSVMVQLRGQLNSLVEIFAFPLSRPDDFSTAPPLVSSIAAAPKIRFIDTDILPGDSLLAMTDETAHWALTRARAGAPIWDLLVAGSQGEVTDAIHQARNGDEIANDDMTVVRIVLKPMP